MISGTTTDLEAAAVLASARGARASADAAEARLLTDAVAWSRTSTMRRPDWTPPSRCPTAVPTGRSIRLAPGPE